MAAKPIPGDPLADNLRTGAAIGLLGIQPETRRRNRMNGRVIDAGHGSFTLAVDQSFGNCPRYIQTRAARFVADPSARSRGLVRREGAILSSEAADMVSRADTFYIASASPGAGGESPVEGADVNHRGGRPGFVDVRQEDGRTVLVSPDFAGNSAFSTFGNLLLNPKSGLLFVDFSAGHLLMLTGEAEVLWDTPPCRYRLDDLDAIADAVTRGMGLSWLPHWLVRKRIEAGTLVRVWPDQEPFLYDCHVLWLQSPHMPLRVRLAIDALASQLPKFMS